MGQWADWDHDRCGVTCQQPSHFFFSCLKYIQFRKMLACVEPVLLRAETVRFLRHTPIHNGSSSTSKAYQHETSARRPLWARDRHAYETRFSSSSATKGKRVVIDIVDIDRRDRLGSVAPAPETCEEGRKAPALQILSSKIRHLTISLTRVSSCSDATVSVKCGGVFVHGRGEMYWQRRK